MTGKRSSKKGFHIRRDVAKKVARVLAKGSGNGRNGFDTYGRESTIIPDMVGMTINTSNSNYVGGGDLEWQNPDPGTTVIGLRYHSNNTIDLYDFTGNEIIGTVNATQDGNPVYISVTFSDPVTTTADMNDDFFAGGDVGIALTTN